MTSEIFIENKRLDMGGDISALLTFALDDVKDFAARNTTFSKTIVLPGTANNNLLFGHIFKATVSNPYDSTADNVSTNFNASVSADCIMMQNHVQIFKGTMRLLEIVVDKGVPEYEVAVFGELAGLVGALGTAKLEDLDFSAYDHTWNVTNIQNSWNALSTGYYYPLIDRGGVSVNKIDYDIRAFRPGFFVREYIDKIFTNAGYRWESALFDTDRFKRLIIPNNQKDFKRSTYSLINAARNSSSNVLDSGTGATVIIPMTSYVLYFFTGGPTVFTFSGVDPVVTTINLSFTGSYVGNNSAYKLALYKNGVEVVAFTENIPEANDLNTHFYNWTKTGTVSLTTGDTLDLRATATPACGATDNLRLIAGTFKVDSITAVLVDYTPGNTIAVNSTLPRNILQKDFLSSILKLFNLYVYEDKNATKKLYIKPYVDFYDLNVSGVVDWNYKLDRSRVTRTKIMSEHNSRYYEFKFKPDTDYYNELYFNKYNEIFGSMVYDSAYESARDKTTVDLIFSPTVLVGYSAVDKIVPVMYKKPGGIEERMDTNIRILQTKKITGVAAWDIEDAGVDLVSNITEYGYAGNYDDPDAPANDIHFGVPFELFFILATGSPNVTQFNVYWSPYMAEITDKDSKLMTAYFKLNTKDIYDLDFSKLIHVDGSYWRLNKIEDWNASDPDVCKGELLKLINMVY